MSFKKIIIIFLSYSFKSQCNGVVLSQTWVSCSADETALQNSPLMRISFNTASLFECVALATGLPQVRLACHSDELRGVCVLWDEWALYFGNITKNPTLGRTHCKTPAETEDDEMPTSPHLYTTSAESTDCSGEFSMMPFGCIAFTASKGSWNASRTYCLSLGADLYSPDNDYEFSALMSFTGSAFNTKGKELWLSVRRNANNEWWWLNGMSPASHWHWSRPNDGECGYSFDFFGTKLADTSCDVLMYGVCRQR